jgi:hypothetical protein
MLLSVSFYGPASCQLDLLEAEALTQLNKWVNEHPDINIINVETLFEYPFGGPRFYAFRLWYEG